MISRHKSALFAATILATLPGFAHADDPTPATRAAQVVKRMTDDEKTILTHGMMAVPLLGIQPPPEAVPGAGYIHGIERLGIPSLRETDASLGVGWAGGIRKVGATALPSGLSLASSWNPDLARQAGMMIGAEARAKGFNVLLAGGTNLMRDPRNGRTFEYLSEDPLLSGILVGNAIAGVQSNHILSTIKHFALNGQETARKFIDVQITNSAARESDLLAFQIGIEIGRPASVMCAYNKVNGYSACDSAWLLDDVLKRDWRYPGFVMSDWGAVPSLQAAMNGLDQQSGEQLDHKVWFAKPLSDAAKTDAKLADRLDDMNRRIIAAMFANGLDTNPVHPGGPIDFTDHAQVALVAAEQGIVLLRNERSILPLTQQVKTIAVIGGLADMGVLSGGGSSQVHGKDGPVATVPTSNQGPFTAMVSEQYQQGAPLDAIKAAAPQAHVTFRTGASLGEAVALAKQSDVVIVFATKGATEGYDLPDLDLPHGQDALINAIGAANPNTIVVLETGNPVLMPWLNHTAAIVEAWYPGAEGGKAIASVLFGGTNPSGRLPVSFPAAVSQLPRPTIDGFETVPHGFLGDVPDGTAPILVNYNIEGSDVGYRWYARNGQTTLFPFGFGLSYTTFKASGLKIDRETARFAITNTGPRDGADVAQLYLVARAGKPLRRLVGFKRMQIAAGASVEAAIAIEPRVLADWVDGGWSIPAGDYTFALGRDAEHLGPAVSYRMPARKWKD